MTEAEWLVCKDPRTMIGVVRERAAERKLRLLALACCWRFDLVGTKGVESRCAHPEVERRRRHYPHEVEHRRRAIAVLERCIEGTVDEREFERALSDAASDGHGATRDPTDTVGYAVDAASRCFEHISRGNWEWLVEAASEVPAYDALTQSGNPDLAILATLRRTPQTRPRLENWSRDEEVVARLPEYISALAVEKNNQSDWLRDIFGNPFHPVAFSPSWRTSTAVALASQMYESREFGAMPILGDALQDTGCDSADILDHCRGPGPHVRGCWVVDLVLDKE